MNRMEEAAKQAERRLSKAEARNAELQYDLTQAEHRAQQVLHCPAPQAHLPASITTAMLSCLCRGKSLM